MQSEACVSKLGFVSGVLGEMMLVINLLKGKCWKSLRSMRAYDCQITNCLQLNLLLVLPALPA